MKTLLTLMFAALMSMSLAAVYADEMKKEEGMMMKKDESAMKKDEGSMKKAKKHKKKKMKKEEMKKEEMKKEEMKKEEGVMKMEEPKGEMKK